MSDEIFKLGNFSDDGLEDIDLPTEQRPQKNANNSLIQHPAEKDNNQAIFRSPLEDETLEEISVDMIVPNEYQPRRIFNPEKLQELSDSIKANGIIQPLVVAKRPDGKYEIVVGERRYRASMLAGLKNVPALVRPVLPSQTKLEIALIENVQRADLNPIEEARAYERLNKEFGMTTNQIGEHMGKDSSTISNLMRLLNLPVEVQRALVEEKISEGQARPLLSLRDREEMLAMFKIVLEKQMKVRDIENKVREIRNRKIKVAEMFTPDPFLTSLENLLRTKLGTRVEVAKGAKGGKITIEFYSDEELSDIVDKIA